jgi:hypothetical protein
LKPAPDQALLSGYFRWEFWSGRPGSNRRRPAWEFSIEFEAFSFDGKNLTAILRSRNLLPDSSNFN